MSPGKGGAPKAVGLSAEEQEKRRMWGAQQKAWEQKRLEEAARHEARMAEQARAEEEAKLGAVRARVQERLQKQVRCRFL